MRVSDAIATGRVFLKPIGGTLFYESEQAGCAIGMALAAIGKLHDQTTLYTARNEWPWLTNSYTRNLMPCKCHALVADRDGDDEITMIDVVIHLFDVHCAPQTEGCALNEAWTLDQIIDWVRSVEPEEDAQREAQPAPEAATHEEVLQVLR